MMYVDGDFMDSVARPTLNIVMHAQVDHVAITTVYRTVTIYTQALTHLISSHLISSHRLSPTRSLSTTLVPNHVLCSIECQRRQ